MEEKHSLDETHIDELLSQVLKHGNALHLYAGQAPCVYHRAAEVARELDYELCQPQHVQSMVYDIISDEQIQRFEDNLKLEFVHTIRIGRNKYARFLVLVGRERGNVVASFLALSPAKSRSEPS